MEITVKQINGRLPVVAGVAGVCNSVAVMFAKHAEACGADAVIAMPPYVHKVPEDEILKYYTEISDAIHIPIFIQNFYGSVGTLMGADFIYKLISQIENLKYVKEEGVFSGHGITQLLKITKNLPETKFKGAMGGKAGKYLIDEYRRGCCGNMPACEVADIHAQIWDALEAGNEAKAIEMYNRVLPLLNFEALYGCSLYKEVLKRRGIIKYPTVRVPGYGLDDLDFTELDRILDEIRPLFKV